MKLYKISWRFLFSKKRFSYTNISILLSIASLSLCLSIALLVVSTSRGYENQLLDTVKSAEPDITVTSKFNHFIKQDDLLRIKNRLNKISPDIDLAPYLKNYSMIKNSTSSYGVSVIALEAEAINNFFEISNDDEKYILETGYLYINSNLIKELNQDDSKKIILFDIEGMIENSKIKARSFDSINEYKGNIPVFDNTVFISMEDYRRLFEVEEKYTGIYINNINQQFIEELYSINLLKDYRIELWKDKYQNLLFWLTIFTNPLYLILSFILFLAIIYQLFANWLLFADKHKSFRKLRAIGVSNRNISTISFGISIIILSTSLLFGFAAALLLSFIQNSYNVINVDPSIYILSHLYSDIRVYDLIYLFLFTTIATLPLSKIIINRKINQLKALEVS